MRGARVDARTDVYGLGCVAYQCLTGTVPFVRDNEAALLWAHLVERPPPVSAHRSELAPFDAQFRVWGFTMFEQGRDKVWRPQRDFPFGRAGLPGPAEPGDAGAT